eukprot:scaffold4822_cov73-Cylindrotheca_fusiformis.AAC.1
MLPPCDRTQKKGIRVRWLERLSVVTQTQKLRLYYGANSPSRQQTGDDGDGMKERNTVFLVFREASCDGISIFTVTRTMQSTTKPNLRRKE